MSGWRRAVQAGLSGLIGALVGALIWGVIGGLGLTLLGTAVGIVLPEMMIIGGLLVFFGYLIWWWGYRKGRGHSGDS
jgi:hypothetical protein